MTKRKTTQQQRRRRRLDALEAYRRHYGSTRQREEAAADLGMDLDEFRALLDETRRMGYDIEAAPDPNWQGGA